MKRYDRLVRKLARFGRKNFITRILAMMALIPVIAIHRVGVGFATNLRREAMVLALLLCVVVTASFQFYPKTEAKEELVIYDVDENLSEADWSDEVILAEDYEAEEEIYDTDTFLILDDSFTEVAFLEEDFDLEDLDSEDLDSEDVDFEDVDSDDMDFEGTDSEDGERDPVEDSDKDSEKVTVVNDYSDYEFDPDDWRYILVNKEHPIPDDYEVPLGTISGSMQADERIIDDLLAMMKAAKKDGISLVICSPYRSEEKQVTIFERKVNKYMAKGYSYLDAYKLASLTVTVPGTSEHTLGLSLDIFCSTHKSLDYAFGETAAGKWLQAHSYEYGFILRYPYGKTDITGIDYEPWHFRYVGVEAATVITLNDLTLEEFVSQYLQ